jgi:hypothetical protein
MLSTFSRYCSICHCQLTFTSCIITKRVISTVCCRLPSKQTKLYYLFLKEGRNQEVEDRVAEMKLELTRIKQ